MPDYDTVTRCPWRPDTAAVLCDFYMEDGSVCPMDARQILKNVMAEYAELGLQPRARWSGSSTCSRSTTT